MSVSLDSCTQCAAAIDESARHITRTCRGGTAVLPRYRKGRGVQPKRSFAPAAGCKEQLGSFVIKRNVRLGGQRTPGAGVTPEDIATFRNSSSAKLSCRWRVYFKRAPPAEQQEQVLIKLEKSASPGLLRFSKPIHRTTPDFAGLFAARGVMQERLL